MYFSALALVGILLNSWLYIDDVRNRGSVLHRLDKGGKDEVKEIQKVETRPKSEEYSDISSVNTSQRQNP